MTRAVRGTELKSALDGVRFRFGPRVHQTYGIPSETRDLDVPGLLRHLCDFANEPVRERVRRTPLHLQPFQPFTALIQGRDDLAELLHAAVEARPDLINPSAEQLSDARGRLQEAISWRPLLERSAAGPVLLQDAYIGTHEGFSALLTVLLMHRQYRDLLRRCPTCRKYFMREGKRRFCSARCATAANDAGLAERQRRRRLRLAALKLLPDAASRAKRAAGVKEAFKSHPEVTTAEQLAEYAAAVLKPPRRKSK